MFKTKPTSLQYVRWDDFSGGLNTKAPADELEPSFTPDCSNVYFGDAGEMITRNGYTKWDTASLAATIYRVFDYQTSAGAQQLLVGATTTLKQWTNPGFSTTVVSGLVTGAVSICTFHDSAFITDGTTYKRWNGTTAYQWGITAPVAAPTLSEYGSGTTLIGVYHYKFTYYRGGTYPQESSASPASAAITVASKGVTLAAITTSSDTQVTARRIYRTSGDGGTYYYLATISDNTTVTYNDNIADTSLTTTLVAPTDHTPPATLGKYATLYKNRIFLGNPTARTIYFSALDEPESFPTPNSITLATNDADQVTGMSVLHDALFCFTEDSIWMITGGYTAASFARSRVLGVNGCIAPESIVNTGNALFYLSDDGIQIFDGSSSNLVSKQITPSLQAISFTNRQACVGCYYPAKQQVWFSFPAAAKVYVLDLEKQYWTVYDHTIYGMGLYELTTGDAALLGGNATYLNRYDSGTQDDGASIAWYWTSPWADGGGKEWQKCLRRAYLTGSTSGSSYTTTCSLFLNQSTAATMTANPVLTSTRSTVRSNIHGNGQFWKWKVSGTGGSVPVTITEIAFFFLPKWRR